MQLVSAVERKEVKIITRPVFDADLDAGKLHRHLKGVDDCKQLPDDSKDEKLAEEGLTKEIIKSESRSLVSGAVLHK